MIHNSHYGEIPSHDLPAGAGLPIIPNEERRQLNTIISTARTMKRVKEGIMTEEDLDHCLEINSKNIGYSPEQLKDAAEKELERQEDTATPSEIGLETSTETIEAEI